MLDLRILRDNVWSRKLKPIGYGGLKVESYEDWIIRTSDQLSNLNPEICEQWVHRHWENSPLCCIPLETLKWREERWEPLTFLSEVRTWRGNEPLNPEFDYETFARPGLGRKHPTAEALDNGEWDYAPIVLDTPNGFIDTLGEKINSKYLLVEGHQRRRYLNALICKGTSLMPQRVFILNSPITEN